MTRETDGRPSSAERGRRGPGPTAVVSRIRAADPGARIHPTWVPATVVLGVVGAGATLRVANNVPGALPAPLGAVHRWVAVAGPVVVALAVVLLGVAHRDGRYRAGLVVAGVFGLLGAGVPVATLPATVAIVGGAAVPLVVATTGATPTRVAVLGTPGRHAAVAGVVWLGLAAALGSATGVLDGSLRPLASTTSLVGVALLPLAVDPDLSGWLAGALVAVAVLWVGATAPFVAGATVLVGFGVVGAPLVAVAGAAGGAVAGTVGAVAAGRWDGALAAGLLLVAGVPATLPRALAVTAGLALLVGGEHS